MTHRLRQGDEVSIAAFLASDPLDFDGEMKVKVSIAPYHEIFVLASDVTVIKPLFRIGDRVAWSTHDGADSWDGCILSIANDHLWVQLDDGSFATVWASKANRVDLELTASDDAAVIEPPPTAPEIVEAIEAPADVEVPTDG